MSWRLKAKNAASGIRIGSLEGIKAGLRSFPPTMPLYLGYEYAYHGKKGLLKATDTAHAATNIAGDIMEETVDNFHDESTHEKSATYYEMVIGLGGGSYSKCADMYEVYLGRNKAKLICQRIMTKSLTAEDYKILKGVEKGAIKDAKKEITPTPTLPSMPSIPSMPSLPSLGLGSIIKSTQIVAIVLMVFIALIFYIIFVKGRGAQGVTVVGK